MPVFEVKMISTKTSTVYIRAESEDALNEFLGEQDLNEVAETISTYNGWDDGGEDDHADTSCKPATGVSPILELVGDLLTAVDE